GQPTNLPEIIENDTTTKRTTHSIFKKVVVQLTTVGIVLGSIGLRRYVTGGPYSPWSCSVFGYQCDRLYDFQFNGYVHEDYISAESVFKKNFYTGEEVGAATAAYVDGELVLDIQGGWQDPVKKIPYTNKTLQMVFSSTKALTSIVVAQFIEKGVLDYEEKISTYWPEFAQGNKENVTLSDLMQHAAGVNYLENGITFAEAEDSERFSRILASQPHAFGGVRTRSYHAASRGWYINEILKRVAGVTVNDVAAEFNKKYDIEWYLRPYQEEYDERISHFYGTTPLIELYLSIKELGFANFIKAVWNPDENFVKTADTYPNKTPTLDSGSLAIRRIESPSYSGHTNARSIAKLAAMMANEGKAIVKGEPDLFNANTYALVTEQAPLDFDLFFKRSIKFLKGGWGNHGEFLVEGVQFVGWPGLGGSTFLWNDELKIGFAYHMNGIPSFKSPDDRSMSILAEIVKQVQKKNK
ncbi:hypothetical protein INT45_002618, partial [Circinella minor]